MMSTPSSDAVASTPVKENSALFSSNVIGKNWYQPNVKVPVPRSRLSTRTGGGTAGAGPLRSQCPGATWRRTRAQ